jgi:hypothetical protein
MRGITETRFVLSRSSVDQPFGAIEIMPTNELSRTTIAAKGLGWFLFLWLLGVGGTALIELPFHLLVMWVMPH